KDYARVRLSVPIRPAGVESAAAMLSSYSERSAGYPDSAGLRDLEPREGDLVPFTFRLLSAAYLGSSGYYLDFSREGVLERALPLFREPEAEGSVRGGPLVVVRDHSFAIEDRIGLVRNAEWSMADETLGLSQPGIDAELHINWKLAADVVRRLWHDPPLLDACSVSLGFRWEKSHPALDDNQFWGQLGEEVDGTTVRVIVTEIFSVEHVGLVFAGADTSARRTSVSACPREPVGGEFMASNMHANLAEEDAAGSSQEGGTLSMEDEALAISPESPLWRWMVIDQPDVSLLEQRAREMSQLAALGQAALADLRREVQGLIVQFDGATETGASEGLQTLTEEADLATLRALKAEYTRRLEVLIPARCQVCGSEQVSRRSSRERSMVDHQQGEEDPRLYR
ncbi:MAG: hypothetical protein JSU61_07425, partial [Fidelibacterota bacterium]